MTTRPRIHHCPNTRSSTLMLLVEELGCDVDVHVMNMKAGENREPAYLAINPLGKVPAVEHRGQIVTETVACMLYLADLYPAAGLAPGLDDQQRGSYLRWMVFYAAAFEPAVVDAAMKREPAAHGISTYGTFDGMLKVVTDQLAAAPYLLGERFSAADVLWGSGLSWTTGFGLVPKLPAISAYIERVQSRPAHARHAAKEAALAARFAG